MKIIADSHIPYIKEYFSSYGELVLLSGRALQAADVKDADILLVRSITKVNEALLKNSQVKFVGSLSAGADHLDTKWLTAAGIDWATAEGFNAPTVADYLVSLIAALQCRQHLSTPSLKAAVIGVGHVGKLVANRLALLGFEVILCDPIRAENEKNFISTPLQNITDVDLVTLHVPLTMDHHPTHHFITKDFLQAQKENCILLNASRGGVIETQTLLQYGQHLIWCLDVFENEPHISRELLAKSLITTPHIAGHSIQAKLRCIDIIHRIAQERKFISTTTIQPILIPRQKLSFAGKQHRWQDIILGVFNPALLTAVMRNTLWNAEDIGVAFDTLRNNFNYRHELAYVDFVELDLIESDKQLLGKICYES